MVLWDRYFGRYDATFWRPLGRYDATFGVLFGRYDATFQRPFFVVYFWKEIIDAWVVTVGILARGRMKFLE